MATYEYRCPKHGIFDAEHRMSEKLTHCPMCAEEDVVTEVVRLISRGTTISLKGMGWAADNYSKKE
jgi:putative FmdB family regulatory protein